jgi:hypothetical protein
MHAPARQRPAGFSVEVPLLLSANPGKYGNEDHRGDNRSDHVHRVEIREVRDYIGKEEIYKAAEKRTDQAYDQGPPEFTKQGLAQDEGVEHGGCKTDCEVCQSDVEIVKKHNLWLLTSGKSTFKLTEFHGLTVQRPDGEVVSITDSIENYYYIVVNRDSAPDCVGDIRISFAELGKPFV